MTFARKSLHLVTALVAAAMLPAIPAAEAQVISNTASAHWTDVGGSGQVQSNRVDVTVEAAPPPPPSIATYRLTGGGGRSVPLGPTQCGSAMARSSGLIELGGVYSGIATQPASLQDTSSFHAGEMLVVGVTLASANADPQARDTLPVILELQNGDREQITLTETANNSGEFVGFIPTIGVPPAIAAGDCRLSVNPGAPQTLRVLGGASGTLIATATINFLVDPFGIVFDSGDGAPVAGSRVTIIDTATGQPAQVFGDDGISAYPSSVITGQRVTDSGGTVYDFPPGDYRFPFVAPGSYRLLVEPPSPYTAPSGSSPADLAGLRRPDDGQPFTITDASYSRAFTLDSPAPVRVDIPVDQPGLPLILRKTTSTQTAVPGDVVQYRIEVANRDARRSTGAVTVSDVLPAGMRLRPDTVRANGTRIDAVVAGNGREFRVTLPGIAPSGTVLLTYLAEVTVSAEPGNALNRASAADNRGTQSNVAEATIAIKRDQLGDRMTIIGRITDGGCAVDPGKAPGIAGVRVMLQDGSYTVTDEDGRYHFEGVRPGLHVVQIDPSTLPLDREAIDCARSTASAGSAISRFVEGRGGALKRADFRARASAPRTAPKTAAAIETPKTLSDPEAAGAGRDWLAGETPGIGWVFPASDYNPRAKSIRAVVKHAPGQSVVLRINGKPVDALTFEGARKSADGQIAVSVWRGIEIREGENRLTADVKDANGALVQTIERAVHYSVTPMRAALVREKSVLVADGVTRPVIAVRLTDRDGKPVRHGLTGDFSVPAPYYPAVEADAQQARQLAGLEKAQPVWKVEGDDGMAFIELEPTTASGTLTIDFNFRDDKITREQTLEMWLDPGDRQWTVVGFAAGTLGYNTLDDRMEPVAEQLDDLNADARLALYAKGRVLGQWLMTLAYDSDKEKDDARFGGVIDPRAYYTIYADRNETRHDAASVRKLYLRLERPQFYAMFGDFETGISEPQLARYQRALNGGKAEYRGRNLAATAFVADTPYRFRRDEIQGNDLTGPYQLGAKDILPNSERISIETRDRLHSERIVETLSLTRHIDYDIDYLSGTIRFRSPVLSRSSDLDPQFIIAEYEVDGVGQRVLNAGGRVSYQSDDEKLRVGATFIHDENGSARTNLGGVDARYRPTVDTEVRAELAVSDAKATNGGPAAAGSAKAWLIEAEHHSSNADFLAYVRERERGFGTGQLSSGEDGTRKFGFDARLRATKALTVTGSAWQEDYLNSGARRRAARALIEYDNGTTVARAGLTHADDRLSDGSSNRSNIVQIGATQRLFDKKLELDAQTEFALGGEDASVDFPTRHRIGARYAVTRDVNLVGSYEVADGDTIRARTARIGFDVAPWAGGRLLATANRQDIGEYGPRSFAAYGLSQSLQLSKRLSVDLSIDGNRILGGIRAGDVLNPDQPVASGGFLGSGGTLTEDFLAVSGGATWRADQWTLTGRAEYRDGEVANRYGLTLGGLRQLGEGRALGALFTYAKASGSGTTPTTEVISFEMSWAHRPADSQISWLNKTEARSDKVQGAVAGQAGPIGGALTIDGDATSRRLLNSLSVNWTPLGGHGFGGDGWFERAEIGFFWGTRYNFDRFGADDVKGWSNLLGGDVRFNLGEHVDVGASGTVRVGTGADTVAWAGGPTVTLAPMDNANITFGYNFAGFHDRDFEDARFSRSGAYVTFKLKFDQTSFAGLGL